jgi:hypothetical protein
MTNWEGAWPLPFTSFPLPFASLLCSFLFFVSNGSSICGPGIDVNHSHNNVLSLLGVRSWHGSGKEQSKGRYSDNRIGRVTHVDRKSHAKRQGAKNRNNEQEDHKGHEDEGTENSRAKPQREEGGEVIGDVPKCVAGPSRRGVAFRVVRSDGGRRLRSLQLAHSDRRDAQAQGLFNPL